MKLTTIFTVAAIAVAVGTSVQAASEPGAQVNVYCHDNNLVPLPLEGLAKGLAVKMFAEAGVNLRWRAGSPSRTDRDSIVLDLTTHTPGDLMPGAMAYALPYEGIHIRLFWDRIQRDPNSNKLLAHVMVHEITHVLQGEARHSADGIMKAHWSEDDIASMDTQPLRFAPEDVFLIHAGLNKRQALNSASATVDMTALSRGAAAVSRER